MSNNVFHSALSCDEPEIRWGVVGTGHAARKFRTALAECPSMRIAAVFSRTERNANEYLENATFVPVEEMDDYLDRRLIDAVYVATPVTSRLDILEDALRSKTPVLCEKPLAFALEDVTEILRLARKQNTLLVEGIWTLYTPCLAALATIVSEKSLGAIQSIEARFCKVVEKTQVPRLFDIRSGGGALFDLGIYPIALTTSLMGGDPTDATVLAAVVDRDIDRTVSIQLEYPSGSSAQIEASLESYKSNNVAIRFEQGNVFMPDLMWPDRFIIELADGRTLERVYPLRSNGMDDELEHVADCLAVDATHSHVLTPKMMMSNYAVLQRIRRLM